jgi:hypothetical protein
VLRYSAQSYFLADHKALTSCISKSERGPVATIILLTHIRVLSDLVILTSYQARREGRESTDHEFITARNATLAAMQDSASGSNVCYYPT